MSQDGDDVWVFDRMVMVVDGGEECFVVKWHDHDSCLAAWLPYSFCLGSLDYYAPFSPTMNATLILWGCRWSNFDFNGSSAVCTEIRQEKERKTPWMREGQSRDISLDERHLSSLRPYLYDIGKDCKARPSEHGRWSLYLSYPSMHISININDICTLCTEYRVRIFKSTNVWEGGFDLERFLHDKSSLLRSSRIHTHGIQGPVGAFGEILLHGLTWENAV